MTKLAWVAEDASGNIFAVGLRQPGSDATEYGGMVFFHFRTRKIMITNLQLTL